MDIEFHEVVRNWVVEITNTVSFYMLHILKKHSPQISVVRKSHGMYQC